LKDKSAFDDSHPRADPLLPVTFLASCIVTLKNIYVIAKVIACLLHVCFFGKH